MAFTMRPTDEDTDALRALAAAQGRSMHDVALTAIREYVAAHSVDAVVDRSVAETLPRYQELFDRLGRA